jgi:Rha family phage regulatory protein
MKKSAIPAILEQINKNKAPELAIDARELYKAFAPITDFHGWFRDQVLRARLKENVDYVRNGRERAKNRKYLLTLNAAKRVVKLRQYKKSCACRYTNGFLLLEVSEKNSSKTREHIGEAAYLGDKKEAKHFGDERKVQSEVEQETRLNTDCADKEANDTVKFDEYALQDSKNLFVDAEIMPFRFKEFYLRTLMDDGGKAWFYAHDVIECLGRSSLFFASEYLNAVNTQSFKVWVVTGKKADGSDDIQRVALNFVDQNGLNALIYKLRSHKTKVFRRLITETVLPHILQKRQYKIKQKDEETEGIQIKEVEEIYNDQVVFGLKGHNAFVSSLDIAKVFEKNHDDIIRDIRALPDDSFRSLNFEEVEYEAINPHSGGVAKYPAYNVFRDGFTLLVKDYPRKIQFTYAFDDIERLYAPDVKKRCARKIANEKEWRTANMGTASFEFEGRSLLTVTDGDGKVWFCGKDAAEMLGYKNTGQAVNNHCKGVTKRYPIETTNGVIQKAVFIAEPDLRKLIIKSHLPEAERIEKWLMDTVLPSILQKRQCETTQESDRTAANTGIVQFEFDGQPLRTDDDNGEIWFCANDVCACLGYSNPRDALDKHCDRGDVAKRDIGVVTGKKADGSDAIQQVATNFVNESGLYALIFGSRLPKAKMFKRWITSEVLPSIRKTDETKREADRTEATQQAKGEQRKEIAVINNQEVVFGLEGDKVFVSSLDIAKVFEKNHAHVLRDIRTFLEYERQLNSEPTINEGCNRPNFGGVKQTYTTTDFTERNFALVEYADAKGEKRPAYNITRDGFTLLTFTGRKTYQWKVALINAFNEVQKRYDPYVTKSHTGISGDKNEKQSAMEIVPFEFEGRNLRTLTDGGGKLWFCGKDAADMLGYKDATNAIKQHCKGVNDGVVKRHPIIDALGREQEAVFIGEPDLWRLIARSHLPQAQRVEKWIFEEVLPSIRKTGAYQTPSSESGIPSPQVLSLIAIQKLIAETLASQAKIAALETRQEEMSNRVKTLETKANNNGYITPFEHQKLREAVQCRVKELRASLQERYGKDSVTTRSIHAVVWKEIGKRFGLFHYGYLRSSEFNKALELIEKIGVEVCEPTQKGESDERSGA